MNKKSRDFLLKKASVKQKGENVLLDILFNKLCFLKWETVGPTAAGYLTAEDLQSTMSMFETHFRYTIKIMLAGKMPVKTTLLKKRYKFCFAQL